MLMQIINVSSLISNAVSTVAGGIAIYLFVFKRDKIKGLYFSLLNILDQISSQEIRFKLDKLSDFSCNDPEQKIEIIHIMNEIVGQIQGNEKLEFKCNGILKKWKVVLKKEAKLTEPTKRSLISELRENLKRVDVSNIDHLIGEKQ